MCRPDQGFETGPSAAAATVRAASADEIDELVEQTWQVASEGRWIGAEVPFDRAARRERLGALLEGDSSTVLVVEPRTVPAGAARELAGFLTVSVAPFGVADIGMLLTARWRGQGLGTALLQGAMSWAAGAGAHKLWLEVWPHNEAAIALYRRAGFVEEGRKVRHYRRRNGELWDAIMMGRPLG